MWKLADAQSTTNRLISIDYCIFKQVLRWIRLITWGIFSSCDIIYFYKHSTQTHNLKYLSVIITSHKSPNLFTYDSNRLKPSHITTKLTSQAL